MTTTPVYDFHDPSLRDITGDAPDVELFVMPGVVRVSGVARESIDWLWPGRLPLGKLVVLDGDPSLGKSTLTLDWAARVSTSSPWPDGSRRPARGNVVLLSAEDGIADTIRPRLEAHGADLDRIVVFDSVPTVDDEGNAGPPRPPSVPSDLARLEEIIESEQAVLVVVDVLAAFLSSRVDSHRDQDVRGALMPIARMAERTGACVVVLRHLSKTGGTNALYRGGGSIGIIGAARAAMLVAPDPEDDGRRILAMTKSNLAAMPDALAYRIVSDDLFGCGRIAWDGTTAHRAADLLGIPESDDDRSERDHAADFLAEALSYGPMPAKDIKRLARDAGIADRTLDRARQRASVVTRRDGFGPKAKYVWAIVEQSCTPPEDHVRHVRQPSDLGEHGEHEADVANMTRLENLDQIIEASLPVTTVTASQPLGHCDASDTYLEEHERARTRAIEGID